jgi:hypothetical protein
MIVKNEETFLGAAIESARSVLCCDDIVVVDTGSTDRSKEIAHASGARVFDFEWIDDFAAAKNYAASKAEYDWIYALDGDEEITYADIDELEKFLDNPQFAGKGIMTDRSNGETYLNTRLYNRSYYKFKGRIHEKLVSLDDQSVVANEVPLTSIHHGYVPEVHAAQGKHERNTRIIGKLLMDDPDDMYLLYMMGKTHFINDRNLPGACECFERVLDLCENEHYRLDYIYETVECYGYALVNSGQYDKALEVRNNYAEYYEHLPQFRFISAQIFQNNALFTEAVQMYESCIGAKMPKGDFKGITSYLSYYNIGVIFECVGMIDDAIDMYKSCSNYEPALHRLADLT